MKEAMKFASAAASLTVSRLGAQQAIPYETEVDQLLEGYANEEENHS